MTGPLGIGLRGAVLLIAALAAAVSSALGSEPEPDSAEKRQFDEVRALWVVRYALHSPEAVREMVADAAASGFNTLLVQVRGRADALYSSSLEPRAELLADSPPFDPLQTVIDEAHERGLAVHAWVNTHLVWGPADPPQSPTHLVNAHPDWLAVPRSLGRELYDRDPRHPAFLRLLTRHARINSARFEGLYSSPSHPQVQERVEAVWLELAANYDLDGIHFDYVRLPSPDFDYSRGALERFREWVRPRVPADRFDDLTAESADDPLAFTDALTDLWDQFRREQVSALVRRIYRSVKEVCPDLTVSAAVKADPHRARTFYFQSWWGWLADGILDVAVPMAYTTDPQLFAGLAESARVSAPERDRVWIGVGAYKNPVDATLWQIEQARAQGVGGVVVFSYGAPASTPAEAGAPTPLQRIGSGAFSDS